MRRLSSSVITTLLAVSFALPALAVDNRVGSSACPTGLTARECARVQSQGQNIKTQCMTLRGAARSQCVLNVNPGQGDVRSSVRLQLNRQCNNLSDKAEQKKCVRERAKPVQSAAQTVGRRAIRRAPDARQAQVELCKQSATAAERIACIRGLK
ncbi:MAG: hypothetical protein V1926_03895 [Candidatus Peregrinibacteria bacterium]